MVLLTRGLSTTTLEPSAVCVEMFPIPIINHQYFLLLDFFLFSVVFKISFSIVENYFHLFLTSTHKVVKL